MSKNIYGEDINFDDWSSMFTRMKTMMYSIFVLFAAESILIPLSKNTMVKQCALIV